MTIPAKVNYVTKGANLYKLGFRPGGAAMVARQYLGSAWLWEKVRVQGGAYGGFCNFDRRSGAFTFGSYRDPNLLQTLENYDGSAQFLRTSPLDADRTDPEHHRHDRADRRLSACRTPRASPRWAGR